MFATAVFLPLPPLLALCAITDKMVLGMASCSAGCKGHCLTAEALRLGSAYSDG